MKKFFQLALLLLAVGFMTSCGSETAPSETENATESTETTTEASTDDAAATDEVDMTGPEYTSAYVCPMHCAGSGSAEPGTCPACGMDYVANDAAPAAGDGHDHDNHEGHNH
ncbi:MAG: heavy metal-binding domain-containing protein [Saprospiraceae bacterium]